MNFIKFLRDLMIWLSKNYSMMPMEFKSKFCETDIVNARVYLYDACDPDSELNQDFDDYE